MSLGTNPDLWPEYALVAWFHLGCCNHHGNTLFSCTFWHFQGNFFTYTWTVSCCLWAFVQFFCLLDMSSPLPSQAASVTSVSPQTAIPAEWPKQPAFNDTETEYLEGFLDQYLVYTSKIKGDKKKWVKLHVYPKYTAHFNSAGLDEPNLASLSKACVIYRETIYYINLTWQKMTWWYSNKANQKKAPRPVAVLTPNTVKKPCATGAEALFAKSHEAELCAATRSQLEAEGDESPGHNLVVYREIKKSTYTDLPDAEKGKWEMLAKEHNERVKLPPSADYIYEYVTSYLLLSHLLTIDHRHQSEILGNATIALQALIGHGWGQHSDIVFFLQGGYCEKAGGIKTFQ